MRLQLASGGKLPLHHTKRQNLLWHPKTSRALPHLTMYLKGVHHIDDCPPTSCHLFIGHHCCT